MPTQDQLRAHTDRAAAALSRGALDDALHEFSQAIYLDPRDVTLRQRMGDLLARMGRKAEAIAQFQHVAGHYAAKGDLLRAIAVSRAILDLDPQHLETQATLAHLYARKVGGTAARQTLPSSMSGAALGADGSTIGPKKEASRASEVTGATGTKATASAELGENDDSQLLDLAELRALFSHPTGPLPRKTPSLGGVPWDNGPTASTPPQQRTVMGGAAGAASTNANPASANTAGAPTAPSTNAKSAPAAASAPPPGGEIVDLSIEAVVDLSSAKSTPLFSMLDEESFLLICEKLALRWVKAGEAIVREGEPGDSMFVVVQGSVNVVREQPGTVPKLVATMGEGAFFGEMALVARSPRLATVFAATDGLLFEIDREALNSLSLQHPMVERVVHDFFRDRLLNNLLAASPIFRAFLPDERRRIATRFTMVSLPLGTTILAQGKLGTGLFVLLRGQCEVFDTAEDGSRHAYPQLHEGDVFGEISLLFATPCTATVRSLTHVELLELPEAAFNELVRPHAQVRELIDRMARERLSRTTDLLMARDEVMDSWLV